MPPYASAESPSDRGTGLLRDYALTAAAYDEVFESPAQPRPPYAKLLAALDALGTEEFQRRFEQGQRLIRENGTTYNAYGDPGEAARPWNLDLLPLVLDVQRWSELAEGLLQRARLLNAILNDLYGPQLLLQSRQLPAELLFAHPAFLRALHGQRPAGDCFINFYAADLVRDPHGNWLVSADRSDAPQGAGYALENRIVTSRLLPSIIHDCHVERLASFFLTLQEVLRESAPQHRENPRIVLLSQGPSSPSYFEDAYLSRYLGYTLVEGGDLTVRGDRVMLKTLGGLLQVDVLMRRLSDLQSDPLELRGDPGLGIAGLLQAVRSGNVAVINPLGSSLVESPALLPYLPALCREMLGETLRLPSVPTWWCGDREGLRYVLEHLDELNIRAAYRRCRLPAVPTEVLDKMTLAERRAAIQARPHDYVGQARVELSTVPLWTPGGWHPTRAALRTYVVLSGSKDAVLPGGLLRVSSDPRPLELSILAGEASKDAWVLSRGPVSDISLLQPPGRSFELRRSGAELPSRVADNLFWLGRYVERADSGTRLLRTTASRLASESGVGEMPELAALLRYLAAQGQIEPGFVVDGIRDQLPEIAGMLPAFALDPRQPTSLYATLASMHRLASLVRDRISIDSWRILHRIDRDIQPLAYRRDVDLSDLLALLNRIVIDLAAFSGLVAESTTRTQGWRFLDIGRRLERALGIIELVRCTFVDRRDDDPAVLEAVLEVADSIMTYRSRYLTNLQPAPVLDLLLTDETNPRSLAFQLATLAEHVDGLPREQVPALRGPEQRIMLAALTSVRMIDIEMLSERARPGERTRLQQTLERLALQLPRLSDMVSHRYLVHIGNPRQLATTRHMRGDA